MKKIHSMSDPMLGRARTSGDIGATFSGKMTREDVMAQCMALQRRARKAQGLPEIVEEADTDFASVRA